MFKRLVKIGLISVMVAGAVSSVSAGEANASKKISPAAQKAAYELFNTMHFKENLSRTAKQLTALQISHQPSMQPYRKTIEDFFNKYLTWDKLKGDMAKLYATTFTTDELKKLNAFYKTPLGQKTIKVMPKLAQQSAILWQKRVASHMDELQKMIAAEAKKIEEASKKIHEEEKKGKK